jgi:cyclopropane-fatty-acyl-phospholipid synthase
MQLARYLDKLFQKDGFLLIDANSNKYIIGTPKNKTPITVKILDKKLHYKLFFSSRLIFWRSLF